jgi:hypothetical protein
MLITLNLYPYELEDDIQNWLVWSNEVLEL